jgi:transposase
MQSISTIGLDIAKSVFQVHGVDAAGQVVIRRQLKRRFVLSFFEKLSPCLVGIEACASSHYWSRELQALGHTVRLMPPAYVKPYVKRQKNDTTDAEAICEAVTRPNMRFVPTKTVEQQSGLMLHRARHLFVRQQTAVINSIRAYLAEFGIVAPVGRRGVEQLLEVVADTADRRLPCGSRQSIAGTEGSDSGVRQAHYRLASIKRDEQTAGRDPWRRAGAGHSSGRERCRCQGLPIGSGFLGLGWARAEAELERGQGQAWQYQQTR